MANVIRKMKIKSIFFIKTLIKILKCAKIISMLKEMLWQTL